jgi:hypothetical protein
MRMGKWVRGARVFLRGVFISSDPTAEIVKKLSRSNGRISVLRNCSNGLKNWSKSVKK